MIMNFIACVVCALCAIYWAIVGDVGMVLIELVLAMINLPYAIMWCQRKIYWHKRRKELTE